MDIAHTLSKSFDLPIRAWRRVAGQRVNYRESLFEDLKRRLGQDKPRRILEIGPKDGDDTRRLLTLGSERLVCVDLPNQRKNVERWLPSLGGAPIQLIWGNIMYDHDFETIEPFDLVWCTGVLYHNPEQLRFVRQMYDLTAPGGLLVLETATARRPRTRNENCVEIWYPQDKLSRRGYHVSTNVTHLPSAKAVHSWMQMVGFSAIEKSGCHRAVGRALAADRVAYIAERPRGQGPGVYYGHAGHEFPIGRAR
jgi:SAM-dependent methyltransferase